MSDMSDERREARAEVLLRILQDSGILRRDPSLHEVMETAAEAEHAANDETQVSAGAFLDTSHMVLIFPRGRAAEQQRDARR